MRLLIIPGPVDKVHLPTCGHTRRAVEAGRTRRVQGKRADALLHDLGSIDNGTDLLASDGGQYPSGYLRGCLVCKPWEANGDG